MITYVVTKCYNQERKVLQCLVWVTVDDDRHTYMYLFVRGVSEWLEVRTPRPGFSHIGLAL